MANVEILDYWNKFIKKCRRREQFGSFKSEYRVDTCTFYRVGRLLKAIAKT